MIKSINPYNQSILAEYSQHTPEEVSRMLNLAQSGQQKWSKQHIKDRSKLALNVQSLLKKNLETFSVLMSQEMGKPIKESRSEIEKCAWLCEYYAHNSETFLRDENIETQNIKSYITYQPMGVILGIMPWNFPFWQVIRFAIPTLLAGNTLIVKHASNVPQCALAIEKLFLDAGFPEYCFQNIFLPGGKTQKLIESPFIQGVSLTGSTEVGVKISTTTAKELKHCVLELGGSDPYIILKDANIKQAAQACVTSRFINSGQSCIAAKRIIVDTEVYDGFTKECLELIKNLKTGDPLDESFHIGPLARVDLYQEVCSQVEQTIQEGAKLAWGAAARLNSSSLYPATLLVDVTEEMCSFKQEIFGPIMSIIKANNEDHAIELANKTNFGLGAAIFSEDLDKAEHIAKTKLNAGSCSVNSFVKSDPRLPFGGIKHSGQGRELSHHALREFCYLKTIVVNN